MEGEFVFDWKWIKYRNELWCAVGNHNYLCHMCARGFLDSNLIKSLLTKHQFHEIGPNLKYSLVILNV